MARQLAQEWEAKLAAQQQRQADYRRVGEQRPRLLSAAERDAIRQLAQDLPALWHAATTTVADRKAILRQLIHQIRVASEEVSERLQVTIDWASGNQSTGVVIRPISQLAHLSYYPPLCERVRQLAAEGLNATAIAEQLAHDGYRTSRNQARFRPETIRLLMNRLGLRQPQRRPRDQLKPQEWWLTDLARQLEIPSGTRYRWLRRGELQAYQHATRQRWVVWADPTELERLRQARARSQHALSHQRWLDADTSPSTG